MWIDRKPFSPQYQAKANVRIGNATTSLVRFVGSSYSVLGMTGKRCLAFGSFDVLLDAMGRGCLLQSCGASSDSGVRTDQ
jgi:hypothetical protein